MTPPPAELITVLFSEDVRQERSGRSSFMGVFGTTIEVERVPVILPALCATVILRNPREEYKELDVSVFAPSGKQVHKVTAAIPKTERELPYVLSHTIKAMPMPLDAEGDIRFVFLFDRDADEGLEASIKVVAIGKRA